jgi:hypothetical protein
VGLIWTFIDLFLIPGMVNKARDEARTRIMTQVMATSS